MDPQQYSWYTLEEKWLSCLQLLQYRHITVLQLHGLPVMLLVHGRGEMAVLPAFTAVLLHQIIMHTLTHCNAFLHVVGEMTVLPAVTEVHLHHGAMDIGLTKKLLVQDCGKWRFCVQ